MYFRSVNLAFVLLASASSSCTCALAQVIDLPAVPKIPFSSPSNPPLLKTADDPAARSHISDSLKSEAPDASGKSTGDPILDDVLQVIRRQGSVLEGSVLDPNADPAWANSVLPANEPNESESLKRDSVYVAAEQLLRVSRMLERLPGRDLERKELVRAMRGQAAKLLIDAISNESKATSPQASASP